MSGQDGDEQPSGADRDMIQALQAELRETNEGLLALTLEREEHERTLTALHESSRELLHAETAEDVSDLILETTNEVLGIPGVGVYFASEDGTRLSPAATTEYVENRFGSLSPVIPDDDSVAWRSFVEQETIVMDDGMTGRDEGLEAAFPSGIWLPLGTHGVMVAVSDGIRVFDADKRQLAGLLAATAEAALDRVEQEKRRRRREAQLEGLVEATGELLGAETVREVCDTVVETAETALGLPITMIAVYDSETGTLRPRAQTAMAGAVVDVEQMFDPQAELAWQSFAEKRVTVHDEMAVVPDADGIDADTYGVAILPLGRHGVLVIGSRTTDDVYDERLSLARILAASTEPSLARLLATNAESSLDRAERERQLIERDERLHEQNERLTRLNQINDVIRDIDQALVAADSRTAIEQAVCTQLTTAGPYTFAWIGEYDAVHDAVAPQEWGGVNDGYLDAIDQRGEADSSERGPTERANETQEPQVVEDLLGEPPLPQWRREALKRGYRACIAIPLVYREMRYGVLTVYSDRLETFGDLERTVLVELGETIAYAINAVESKKALVSDEFVELEFEIRDDAIPFLSVTADVGCVVELESVVARSDGGYRVFFTTHGTPSEPVLEHMERAFAVDGTRFISETDEECLFECTVDESSFFGTLLGHGAVPQRFRAEGGDGTIVVALPESADVRLFIDTIQATYDHSELLARREQPRDRDRQTKSGFAADMDEILTDRQREVLRTAYESGFFESPRERTGSEISDTLGVSQPTFNNHLRAAQRKFFELVFESD
ncbi:bacterio-opsin activator domain-containing protein [Natronosalvus halobius]|uniref:bacterio-opsin activator domain-containing protein n=1 Tax=Natronosalvus halobius TaxID=2953746 RepID=UPI0020A21C71|nr:bacterio-opsin activator domain-containing protein [Natronosalvus halobius]USZ72471.1 GAF domain-containing protein [Natronosalvus halobius]